MKQEAPLHKRLTARVLFFLTLALVPLGIIGVIQNERLANEMEQTSALTVLALSENAASGERQIIQRTFGAALALGDMTEWLQAEPERCTRYLQRFMRSDNLYTFVGFIRADGIAECTTVGGRNDFSSFPNFAKLLADPVPKVLVDLEAPISNQPVLIVSQPIYKREILHGFFVLSVPLASISGAEDFLDTTVPLNLATFNTDGAVLSSQVSREEALTLLPADISLTALAGKEASTFRATGTNGDELVFSVVPIIPDVVYALAIWPDTKAVTSDDIGPRVTAALPALMWLASLLVVWLVVDRLVIRRITLLNRDMTLFAQNRELPAQFRDENLSAEFDALESSFQSMARDIIQDEAAQENRLREKSVLLKEVHHRVKNNLQIISSIMNMQIRKAHAPETKTALAQVQDRIMGLSGVHRTLYQAENLNQVNAASLLQQLVEQNLAIGSRRSMPIQMETDLDDIIVFPDQAVPLTMLVSEALTNAIKHSRGSAPRISLSLKKQPDGRAVLTLENSRSEEPSSAEEREITGLGQQLIRAFTIQLNGTYEQTETPEMFRIEVDFEVEEFRADPLDY